LIIDSDWLKIQDKVFKMAMMPQQVGNAGANNAAEDNSWRTHNFRQNMVGKM
jgi:hypothetical protein